MSADIGVIHEEPTKQVDPDISDAIKLQDVTVTYNKEEEVKILDSSNDTNDKCEATNENDEKVETADNTNDNWYNDKYVDIYVTQYE